MAMNEAEATLDEFISKMQPEEIRNLRKRLTKALRKAPGKGRIISGYIPEQYIPYLPLVVDYCFQRGYIKKKTDYALTSFAITNLIYNITTKIREEAAIK
jgi:hypothetical protein